jgi:hypothetical protein
VASMDIPATIAIDKRHQNIFEVRPTSAPSLFTSPRLSECCRRKRSEREQ